MKIIELNEESKKNIMDNLLKRSPDNYDNYADTVDDILTKVKKEGDKAVFSFTKEFDKAEINKDNILVTDKEIEEAYSQVDEALLSVIRKAAENIEKYHAKQKQNSWFDASEEGVILGQKLTPIEYVGVYVPGGKAAYPSSVLMNIIPAKVAGVSNIIMTSPPDKEGKITPATLVAPMTGISKIYKVGGAQAIGALPMEQTPFLR